MPGGGAVAATSAGIVADSLRVDGRSDLNVTVGNTIPVLSWLAEGTAKVTGYQVRAASTRALLTQPDLWNTGKVTKADVTKVVYKGLALTSRKAVHWQVRVWDAEGRPSEWSDPSTFEMGLLNNGDWGNAQWIEHPTRTDPDALPIFAKQFSVDPNKTLTKARLYVAGLGVSVENINGKPVTDEVLSPGGTNEQEAVPYRGYDVKDLLESGGNTLGIELGHGEAFSHRIPNPTTGRTDPYSRLLGVAAAPTTLAEATTAGATTLKVASPAGMAVGQTINVDTGDAGARLEQRKIAAIDGDTVTVTPALTQAHAASAKVTRSGSQATPDLRVTPRTIARLELSYSDNTTTNVVSDRSWRTTLGATTSDNWFSGSDFDSRREQVGWSAKGSDLSDSAKRRNGQAAGWIDAGIVGTPNLDTELVERAAEPIRIVDTFEAKKVWQVKPGMWTFDMGQAFTGFVQVKTPKNFPAGTTVRMQIGESFSPDGTVNILDTVEGNTAQHGTQTFDSYTTYGNPEGESWHPQFNHDGFQYVQVTGLPDGFTPTTDMISGLQTMADVPEAGAIVTDNERINRIHKMSKYSIMSNMQAYFTDCPNREKAGWLADMIQSMPAIDKHYDMTAYLHTMMQAIEDAQTKTGVDAGFVPSTTPNDQQRTAGSGIGNDLNWGGAVVLTPFWLYENYADTQTMAKHWDSMVLYMDYIKNRRTAGTTGIDQYFVDNGLGDWASASRNETNRAMTATGAYFKMAGHMSEMAAALGKDAEATKYSELADNIKETYNKKFWNPSLLKYTINPGSSVGGQTAQGIALDYGLVPDEYRENVVDALVDLIYAYNPNGGGPHLNSGMIGLGPVTRALMDNGRDDVLWDLLQEDTAPSYGFFLQPSSKHPNGLTTIPEYWDLRQSQNHMILLQIDEWFTAGLAGIQQADDSIGYKDLVIKPRVVGDLEHVKGHYKTPFGTVRSEWTKTDGGDLTFDVVVPTSSTAEIWVPSADAKVTVSGGDAEFVKNEDGYAVYKVGAGSFSFATGDVVEPTPEPTVPTDPAPTKPPVVAPVKVSPSVSFKFSSSSVKVGKNARATVVVKAKGVARPTGKLTIKKGSKTLRTVTLRSGDKGRRTFNLPKLPKGKHTIRAVYSGSKTVKAKSSVKRSLTVK